MKLIDLITVLDSDTKINITKNYKDVYEGIGIDILTAEIFKDIAQLEVKVVWYSTIFKAIVIEL